MARYWARCSRWRDSSTRSAGRTLKRLGEPGWRGEAADGARGVFMMEREGCNAYRTVLVMYGCLERSRAVCVCRGKQQCGVTNGEPDLPVVVATR